MILDETVIHFLTKTEPIYIHLAVSNFEGQSYSVRGFGVKWIKGTDHLSIYILKSQTEKVLSYIKNGNGMITCLFTDGFSNESYQLKGTIIGTRTASIEDDLEYLTRYRNGSLKLFPKMYSKFPLSPALCDVFTYKVKEIFIQTPGPYAGSRYQRGGVGDGS